MFIVAISMFAGAMLAIACVVAGVAWLADLMR